MRILATDPANGAANLVSTIPLEDGISVQGMYLDGGKMFALTGQKIYGSYGELWADIAIWAPEKLGFRVYDVSDTGNPALEIEASIDGVFVESRRIGNTVYIVSRYTPSIDGLHYYVTTPAAGRERGAPGEHHARRVVAEDHDRWRNAAVVAPERCYVTTDDVTNYPRNHEHHGRTDRQSGGVLDHLLQRQCLRRLCLRDAHSISPSSGRMRLQRDVTRIHKFALAGSQYATADRPTSRALSGAAVRPTFA